jgi:hypothetical protein
LAFRWRGAPSYERLSGLARGIVLALPRTIAAAKPLFIILDGDVAQTVGALLKEELGVLSRSSHSTASRSGTLTTSISAASACHRSPCP